MMLTQNNNFSYTTTGKKEISMAKAFIANVFSWMFLALVITAATAYFFASDPALISSLINTQTGGMSTLGWIVMLAPFGFVLLMSFGFNKLSAGILSLLFITLLFFLG